MKKKWWILLLAALAGLATGAANALYEQRTSVELFFPEDFVARQQSVKATPVEVIDFRSWRPGRDRGGRDIRFWEHGAEFQAATHLSRSRTSGDVRSDVGIWPHNLQVHGEQDQSRHRAARPSFGDHR